MALVFENADCVERARPGAKHELQRPHFLGSECSGEHAEHRRPSTCSVRGALVATGWRTGGCCGGPGMIHVLGQSSKCLSSWPSAMSVYRGLAGLMRIVNRRRRASTVYGTWASPVCFHANAI
jgi:hypothetical protein